MKTEKNLRAYAKRHSLKLYELNQYGNPCKPHQRPVYIRTERNAQGYSQTAEVGA